MTRGVVSPVGTVVIAPNGYAKVKTENGWDLKHHVIWEEHNGPIPLGHRVIFDDKDRTNFDPANLVLEEIKLKDRSIRVRLSKLETRFQELQREIDQLKEEISGGA